MTRSGPRCEVAILAGGKGTRLLARTGAGLPKPMVPVLGKPLLQYQIEQCRRQGFLDIALLVHHQHEAISAYFGDGAAFGVRLQYRVEAQPRGTAGALRDALPCLAERFLLLYGDTYFEVDLRAIWEGHAASGACGTLFLHPNDHPEDSDLVEVDAAGRIRAIRPYPRPRGQNHRNLVNAALYVLDQAGLEAALPAEGQADLAKHTFPAMLAAGRPLNAYISPEYIKDMGTTERLDRVAADITAGLPAARSGRALRQAVFLDRDGTLNREVDHLKDPDDLELLPGVAEAVRRINQSGRLAVMVTNQPVLARGELTQAGLAEIHGRLDALLGDGQAFLDAKYVCPHHPHAGYAGEVPELKTPCLCRKPGTGLIDQAARELQITRSGSWLLGDSTRDLEAGRRSGLRTVLVRTGYAGLDGKYATRPDYACPSLGAAVDWVLAGHPAMQTALLPLVARHLEARVMLLGGLPRAGKSSAAQVLKELFEAVARTAHIIPLEAWLLPPDPRDGAAQPRYDLAAAEAWLRSLASTTLRQEVELRSWDQPAKAAVRCSIGPRDLIILEGSPALCSETLRAQADVRIHLDCPEPIRAARLRDDQLWRRGIPGALEALRATGAEEATPQIQASREHADHCFSF